MCQYGLYYQGCDDNQFSAVKELVILITDSQVNIWL